MKLQLYTVLFAFSGPNVLLLRKAKPDWQAGLLNGIGGKVDATDSSILSAMAREFEEETGLFIHPVSIKIYHALAWDEYHDHKRPVVYFGACTISNGEMMRACQNTIEGPEPCVVWKTDKVSPVLCPSMPNLPFLVEMAECLVLQPETEQKLRQPVVLPPSSYADYWKADPCTIPLY